MTSQVYYRKFRSQTLAEVVGQEPVTKTLLNALSSGRISHAYLFCGPRGTGKTSTARIIAKAVNCLTNGHGEPCNTCEMCQAITEGRALDVIEIDAASNTGVDDIRSLREKVNYAPNQARYKVYIIDEVHMLSSSAANALLKTLEEPPAHVIFILATTEAHKILPTIMSRCQRFDFRRITQNDIANHLAHICNVESITIEPEALRLVARSATGSLRDALNLLEQLTTYYGTEISLRQVQETLGITGDSRTKEIARYIVDNDINASIATLNNVNSDGLNLRQFNRELVEYLRGMLLVKTGAGDALDLTSEDINDLKELASRSSLSQILKAVKVFGQLDMTLENHSTLPLEMAIVDCSMDNITEHDKPAPEPKLEQTPVWNKTTQRPLTQTASQPVTEPAEPALTGSERLTPEPEPPIVENPIPEPEPPAAQSTPEPPTKETEEPTATQDNPPKVFGDEAERLRQDWKRLIAEAPAEIRRSPALAILRSAGIMPISVENGIVVLSSRYPYLKEKLENPEIQKVVEKVISSFLGRPCQVQCIAEDNHLVREALKLGAKLDTEE